MQLIDIAKTVSTLGCMSAGRNCILFLRMCPGKSGDAVVFIRDDRFYVSKVITKLLILLE